MQLSDPRFISENPVLVRINIESLACVCLYDMIPFLFSVFFFNGLDLKVFPLREGVHYVPGSVAGVIPAKTRISARFGMEY